MAEDIKIFPMVKFKINKELCDLNKYIDAERRNRYMAAHIKKTETDYCYWSIISQINNKRTEINKLKNKKSVSIIYIWHCKDKRKDKDNIAFAKKFINDALVFTGILKNDGWNDIDDFSDAFFIDKYSYVEIIIY